MIVMKFGGTSTQDAAAMANVAGIVKSRLSLKPVVVISAIAQATNQLEQAGKLASEGGENEAHEVLVGLFNRHYAIVDTLVKNRQRNTELRKSISSSFAELESLIKGIAILRELTPRTLDHIYSFGELLSSLLISYVFRENGLDAVWLDTKDFMITDDNFTRAAPLMEVVTPRLRGLALSHIDAGKVVVTQGFTGATEKGDRTTMGRESSDFSAAVVAAVLGADDVQIWTDVDGVLTADPKVVENPRKVKVLTFEEAYELSFFGAKVLHPNTMLPALEKNIPIHVFNSKQPHLSGTLITSDIRDGSSVVKSIAYKKKISLLTVRPIKRLSPFVFWDHIYNVLTKYDLKPSLTASSEYSVSVALDSTEHLSSVAHELAEVGTLQVADGKGIVSVVGTNIREKMGVVHDVFSAIPDLGVSMISYGASPSNLTFVIDEDRLTEAVQRLHATFFESSTDRETFETLEQTIDTSGR